MNFLGGLSFQARVIRPRGQRLGRSQHLPDPSKTPPHPWIVSAHWSNRKWISVIESTVEPGSNVPAPLQEVF